MTIYIYVFMGYTENIIVQNNFLSGEELVKIFSDIQHMTAPLFTEVTI